MGEYKQLLEEYYKCFNRFEALERCGLTNEDWERFSEDDTFVNAVKQIEMRKAEEIKSELIMKKDKSVNEVKYVLELLNAPVSAKTKTPGKHSKSLSGKDKKAIYEERLAKVKVAEE